MELFLRRLNEDIFIGNMPTSINYQEHEFSTNSTFSLKKEFYFPTTDLIRLIDQTYGADVSFEFKVLPVLKNSIYKRANQRDGWLKIPQAEWLEKINALDLDRFELITIRVPISSSHMHKPFAEAVTKIRDAEKLYQRGELLGAAVACRAAWNTILTVVPSGIPRDKRLEYLLSSVTGDPRRKEFAQSILKGFNDIVNKGVHLEGDTKTGTPPADLKPEDVLLCIHWYSAAIGYLSSI